MSDKLVPTLRKLSVNPDNLILDPNNPRFGVPQSEKFAFDDYLAPGVQTKTGEKIRQQRFRIAEIERSIRTNGYIPVDYIFVRKYQDSDYYVVLEGNRRVTAIRNLLGRDDLDDQRRLQLETIEVMEVLSQGMTDEQLQQQITYLLGVRHHGSLKQWSPFARARSVYHRYLELSSQTSDTFKYNTEMATRVADTLSVGLDQVKKDLQVYRAMAQVGDYEPVRNVNGMKDRYYSLFADALAGKGKKSVKTYLEQSADNFLLTDEAVERIDNLCQFSESSGERKGAPIRNPAEWGKLDKVLSNTDVTAETKAEWIRQIEDEHVEPSIIVAKREAELRQLEWHRWLKEVLNLVKEVPAVELQGRDVAALIATLDSLMQKLSTLDPTTPPATTGTGD